MVLFTHYGLCRFHQAGEFEIRESRSTPKGPRSRTLASFKELSDEVVAKARAKAAKALEAEELRNAAGVRSARRSRRSRSMRRSRVDRGVGQGSRPRPGPAPSALRPA